MPSTFRVFLCRWLGLHVWVAGQHKVRAFDGSVERPGELPVAILLDHICSICGRTKWFRT